MNEIELTVEFSDWLEQLSDARAVAKIVKRIELAQAGNFGDHKLLPDTGGVSEMRIDTGKGYRVYYGRKGRITYLLISGGDKTTQQEDIKKAAEMWAKIKQEQNNEHSNH